MPWDRVPKDCGLQDYCKSFNRRTMNEPLPGRRSGARNISGGSPNDGSEARVNRLYQEALKRLPKVFAKGRQPSREERQAIEAMRNTRKLSPQVHPACAMFCMMGGDASIILLDQGAGTRGICLCPRLNRYADEFLLYVIGHELGHSGDICSFKQTGLKPGQHPLEAAGPGGSVINCLATLGIQSAKPKDMEIARATVGSKDSFWERLIGIGALADFDKETQGHSHCARQFGPSQMREASADVIGLGVLSDFLEEHPLAKHPDNFKRVFGFFANHACIMNDQFNLSVQAIHPPGLYRVSKIALSMPAIRSALNCSGHTDNLDCSYRGTPPTGGRGSAEAIK